jgi:hypothetical protein
LIAAPWASSGTPGALASFGMQENVMSTVAQPNAQYFRARIAAFPAPLCEACNVPMKLNGEYRASDDSAAARREYQCGLCGKGLMVRRTRSHG